MAENNLEIVEELYLSPPFKTREELEQEVEFWDATTANIVSRCPRYAEHVIREDLQTTDDALAMDAGNALHAALAIYYVTKDKDASMAELGRTWGRPIDFRPNPGAKFEHLHLGHLEIILNNYFDYASRRDTFRPLVIGLDKLNLENVVAAVWRMTSDGRVILGESKIAMRFDVNGEEFIYSGKPDLPIKQGGKVLVMDHKSTNAYLSDWYFEQHRFSNQLRGYCRMINELLDVSATGAVINGLYIGDRAILREFKGTKFTRFGPLLYRPGHLEEVILNQYHWRKVLDYYEEVGYYPQATGVHCRSCSMANLCAVSPSMRDPVKKTEYREKNRAFLDL